MALAVTLLLTACGGGDAQERTQPLPWAEGQPRAYTESYLARHPAALVRPEHVVAVRLEATADGEDDTGSTPGVDEIYYYVERPMTVVLHADQAAAALLSHVVLKDAAGRELARHRASDGAAAAVTLSLDPGVYSVEVHHAAKGDPTAPPLAVFLRLADAGQTVLRSAGGDGLQEPAAQTAPIATAGTSCVACSFDHANMAKADYDGADLSQSTFVGTVLDGASLKLATCSPCTFTSASLRNTDFSGSVLSHSDFGNATMDGVSLSYNGGAGKVTTCTSCSFGGTSLVYSELFTAVLTDSTFSSSRLDYADFTYTDCRQCKFWNFAKYTFPLVYFQGARLDKASFDYFDLVEGRFDGATLDGAGLFGFKCATCSFAPNPASNNQPASLVGIGFAGVEIDHATYEGADLSGARLGVANSPTSFYSLFASGSLKNAKLHNIVPADYFSAQKFGSRRDKGQVDFSGASFAGMDLSHADFSSGAALVTAATAFGDSKLSDGTTGINLSGQNLDQVKTLAGRDLRGGSFVNTKLHQAALACARLDRANLVGAVLTDTDLSRASLAGAQLGVTPGSGATAATLVDALLLGTDFTDADLRSVDLSNVRAYNGTTKLTCDGNNATFLRARLDSASLAEAWLAGVSFTGASLNQTGFAGAKLVDVAFGGATLAGTKFDDGVLWGVDFSGAATTSGVSLANASVSMAKSAMTYIEQDGSVTTFAYEPIALGALALTETSAICPSGQSSPCNTPASLVPLGNPMYPPKPDCTYDRRGNKICN